MYMYFDLDLDINKYRYKAVIDFVSFEFETKKATKGFAIKKNINLTYVKPLNAGKGGAATRYSTSLYDVTSWSIIEKKLASLQEKYTLVDEPKIVSVEVSLDAYSKANSREDIIYHVCYFLWFLENPVSDNKRIANTKASGIGSFDELYRKVSDGNTIYIGNFRGSNADPITMRIYLKETDQNVKEEDTKKHRARIEVTLNAEACPFKTIEEARKYKFNLLGNYFRFRKFKTNLNPLEKELVSRSSIVTQRRDRHRIGGGRRIHSRLTMAHMPLNSALYDRLRNLTRDLQE